MVSVEARILYEEGKTETGCMTGKVIGNQKYEELTREFLKVITV